MQPGENKIDTWTILYYPPGGRKFKGKLTVTNRRLLYDSIFDVSARGLMSEALFVKWGSLGYLEIDKTSISRVEVKKNFLSRQAVLTLEDGSKHIFKYGVLSADNVVEAINKDRND